MVKAREKVEVALVVTKFVVAIVCQTLFIYLFYFHYIQPLSIAIIYRRMIAMIAMPAMTAMWHTDSLQIAILVAKLLL